MSLTAEKKQKIITFLLNTQINNDDEVNELFLEIYNEIARKVEEKYPEIKPFTEKYASVVITEINNEIVNYLKEEKLFDTLYLYYHKLRESISQWSPEGKYLAEIPKLAPFQGSLLELLDNGLIENYASEVEVCQLYMVSFAQKNRLEANECFSKVAMIIKRLEPITALSEQYPEKLSPDLINYRDQLIRITVDYLLHEPFDKAETKFQKALALNTANLLECMKKHAIFDTLYGQYHKIRAYLLAYQPEVDTADDIPNTLPVCEVLMEQLNREIIFNYASTPEGVLDYLSELPKEKRVEIVTKIAELIKMLEPVEMLMNEKQPDINAEIIQYRDHMIAAVVNCLTSNSELSFESEYKKSILSAETAFKQLINDNLHYKFAEVIYPWIPNQRLASGVTDVSHAITTHLPFFNFFSSSRYTLTKTTQAATKMLA
ncbi:hypothetical protein L3V82_00975 [Thiotrichales bacterium 19S3-7]|nr:hypothetical protein [Thiotrichales bacterium 19S3-7]MCF6800734.1 hypothetical protein [Thiotrichales bacterium 19S3-11]